jgi:hypothetical protein
MGMILFVAEFVPVSGTYHHTIDGQIFTAVFITTLALIALYSAYRNFIIHKPTSDAI